MLTFYRTEKEHLDGFKPYFAAQNMHMGDYSLGFQFMWHKNLAPDYALFGDCLILRELFAGKYYFYYPLSLSGSKEQEEGAIAEIEKYCRDTCRRLHFTNVPRRAIADMVLRYGQDVTISDNRRWRDYLYTAESFQTYAGGKYSGQRNHVNKFKKSYPDWAFRVVTEADIGELTAFLHEYEGVQRGKHDRLADAEIDEVYEVLPMLGKFGMVCGALTVGGKIVAFSAGERCGDMLVVHIEKALRAYEGAYPMMAQQFALAFCDEGVKYLNRMDDAGDLGLRKSKLQYLPCEIVDKYNIIPARAIDNLSKLPTLKTERLTLGPVERTHGTAYARLASDTERNRYWGYDWRQDYKGTRKPSAAWFLRLAREDFHHKHEMPLGVFADGELVGEVVLHRFGYSAEVEVGVRLLPEAEGKGYAQEAVRAYTEYAFSKLGIERVEAKCFRENFRSRKMLLGAGMREVGEDETYFYFLRTAAM